MPELLLELLSEEIPARMQARAAEDLKRLVCEALSKAQLTYKGTQAYVTPRRLALVVDGLPEQQPDVRDEKKGPRVGAPEGAVQGFLRSSSLTSLAEAELRETEKGQFFFWVRTRAGSATKDVLATSLPGVIWNFSWPKSMRWGEGRFRWVRPLQSVICLFDGAVVQVELQPTSTDHLPSWDDAPDFDDVGAGGRHPIDVGNSTRGHRFLAPAEFSVCDFFDYREKLRAAKVMLDPAERRALIVERAAALAAAEGLSVRQDDALLDEVTGLVEWPVPMLGSIDPRFMDVPPEVLVTAMRAHQKYISLLDGVGKLAPRFVLVANTEATDGGAAIVAGNERVLRARLSDAKFFWDEDRKRTLESRVPKLAERVFHAKLGFDYHRAVRLHDLSIVIAQTIGADVQQAARAAWLCKADLTSAMVGEFPELQGIMGRYYALHDGEPAELGEAIADHYAPQGPSDRCPTAPVSVAVALADKFDTLVGFFAIGEKPTGSRDPFALRRACLGVIRLIIENGLRIRLRDLLAESFDSYQETAGTTAELLALMRAVDGKALADGLLAFLADRLKVHLREQGVRHDLIAAVFAAGAEDDIVRLLSRVDALRAFLATDDGANLLVAYRRASNIVRIEENKDNRRYEGEVEERRLAESQEIELYRALSAARAGIGQALESERFGEAMTILAGLRAPVDAFFEHVKVNCPDADLRINRLKLLSQIRSALGGVADFSQIEG